MSLNEYLASRPVNRQVVETGKAKMLVAKHVFDNRDLGLAKNVAPESAARILAAWS